jgi:hypothetical protein
MDNFVLVLGAAPDVELPKKIPLHTYCANAAIVLAKPYLDVEMDYAKKTTLVTTGLQIQREDVLNGLRLVQPHRVIIRRRLVPGRIQEENKSVTLLTYSDDRKQESFQKKLLGIGWYKAHILAAFKVKDSMFIRRVFYLLLNKKQTGFSTGLYSVLIAASEHPHANIVISGISLVEGIHFNSSKKFPTYRALRDEYLLKYLPRTIRNRMYTNNPETAKIGKINLIRDL